VPVIGIGLLSAITASLVAHGLGSTSLGERVRKARLVLPIASFLERLAGEQIMRRSRAPSTAAIKRIASRQSAAVFP
jgi:hypothetical protein